MSDYLNTLTVKALREIAKRIGFRFISRYRKAELIALIIAEIDACHTEAIREDKIRTRQSAPKISLIDFPAVDGRVVTEAHAKLCADRGCVSYVKNGIDMGWCPRCGEVTTSEEQITDEEIAETVSDTIVIAPVEIQIPAMLSEYGYSAHGNTYAVDYNRIHEEMNSRKTVSEETTILNDTIASLRKFRARAWKVYRDAEDNGSDMVRIEVAYGVWKDLDRSIADMQHTLSLI